MLVNIIASEINRANLPCHLFLMRWQVSLIKVIENLTQHLTAARKAKYKMNLAWHWLKAGQLTSLGIQTGNHHRIIQIGRDLCRSCRPASASCSEQRRLQRQIKLLRVLSSSVWDVCAGGDCTIPSLVWNFLFLKQSCSRNTLWEMVSPRSEKCFSYLWCSLFFPDVWEKAQK